mmetsp:Transcript_26926/g.84184  ORF Transcript_26926/g.84184 Transcript_26926/m.84184 type:complete len:305 (-) Transcript_26926:711-1625(-)
MSLHIRQRGLGCLGLKMSAATPQRWHCQSVLGLNCGTQGPRAMSPSTRRASATSVWKGQQAAPGGLLLRQVSSVDLRRILLTAALVSTACGAPAGAAAGGSWTDGAEPPLLAHALASEPRREPLEPLWLRMLPCSEAAGVPFQICCTTGLGSGADVWGGSRCRGTRGAMSVHSRTPRMWPCRSLRSLKGTEKSSTATLVPELSRNLVWNTSACAAVSLPVFMRRAKSWRSPSECISSSSATPCSEAAGPWSRMLESLGECCVRRRPLSTSTTSSHMLFSSVLTAESCLLESAASSLARTEPVRM